MRPTLVKAGIERKLAARLVEFLPVAYCRVILEPTGARFPDTFQRYRKDGTITQEIPLASEPVWVAALEFARVDAYILGDRDRAKDGVIGGPGDKTVDAVFVDERNRIIHLVQGKYHQAAASDDADVYKFARRARDFWNADFDEELKHAGPGARKKLQEAHKILHGSAKDPFQIKM